MNTINELAFAMDQIAALHKESGKAMPHPRKRSMSRREGRLMAHPRKRSMSRREGRLMAQSKAACFIPSTRYDAHLDRVGRRGHPGKAARKAEKRERVAQRRAAL